MHIVSYYQHNCVSLFIKCVVCEENNQNQEAFSNSTPFLSVVLTKSLQYSVTL
jgi:hypothetical protein